MNWLQQTLTSLFHLQNALEEPADQEKHARERDGRQMELLTAEIEELRQVTGVANEPHASCSSLPMCKRCKWCVNCVNHMHVNGV